MTTPLVFDDDICCYVGYSADGHYLEIQPEGMAEVHEDRMRERAAAEGIDFDALGEEDPIYKRLYADAFAWVTTPDVWQPHMNGYVPPDEQRGGPAGYRAELRHAHPN
jgi:hypothetical protein